MGTGNDGRGSGRRCTTNRAVGWRVNNMLVADITKTASRCDTEMLVMSDAAPHSYRLTTQYGYGYAQQTDNLHQKYMQQQLAATWL